MGRHVPAVVISFLLLSSQLALLVLAEGEDFPGLQENHCVVVSAGYMSGWTRQGDLDRVSTEGGREGGREEGGEGGREGGWWVGTKPWFK